MLAALLMILGLTLAAACAGMDQGQGRPPAGRQGQVAPKPSQMEMQSMVMDFADLYLMRLNQALEVGNGPEPSPAVEQFGLVYGSAAMAIAAGRDPAANLLNMVVFVSLGRWAVDNYWAPQVLGQAGGRLKAAYQELEPTVWNLAGQVLKPLEVARLRGLIAAWQRANPKAFYVSEVRLNHLAPAPAAAALVAAADKGATPSPAQSLVSERAMFYLERMPRLLAAQGQMLARRLNNAPELAKLNQDAERLAQASQRMADASERLPGRLAANQKAAIKQLTRWLDQEHKRISQDLSAGEARLKGLLGEVRQTVEQGGKLAEQVNQAAGSLERLQQRLASGQVGLKDYLEFMERATTTISQLNLLLARVERLSAAEGAPGAIDLRQAMARAAQFTQGLMDHAFILLAYLVGLLLVGLLVVLVIYRVLAAKVITPKAAPVMMAQAPAMAPRGPQAPGPGGPPAGAPPMGPGGPGPGRSPVGAPPAGPTGPGGPGGPGRPLGPPPGASAAPAPGPRPGGAQAPASQPPQGKPPAAPPPGAPGGPPRPGK
ncbi:MAG: hypothetical protein KKE29_12980 [Proteobacteria bacterium]|nr:hypothetical protein [Pseudomonadota bacterium]MBU4573815.1 hypothetical protein [Pseudomonadota bacterium]MBV1714895.1 hypothetical protein [Desulfarculus sp.]MBV1752684.1 hypothetical protein [Desulfarculus sp.]